MHLQLRQQTRRCNSITRNAGPVSQLQTSARRSFTSSNSLRAEGQTKPVKPPPPPKKDYTPTPDALASFASTVRNTSAFRATTEPYVAYGGTEELFRVCAAQCDYTIPSMLKQPPEPAPKNAAAEDVGEGTGWWFEPKAKGGLGLDVTFNSWAQVVFLHMYIVTVKLRLFPPKHAGVWHQNLLDHFFYAAEDRMAMWHGMSARGVRNKYLKDLWTQWRGVLLSYDEGLIKGDAVLGTAIWRNVLKGKEDADINDIAMVTSYLRHQLQRVDQIDDGEIAAGKISFGDPKAERAIVGRESRRVHEPFTAEDTKELEAAKPA